MLTQKTYKYLTHHYFFSSVTCAIPFLWNPVTHRLSCFTGRLRLLLWHLNNLLSALFALWTLRCVFLGFALGQRHVSLVAMDTLIGILYIGLLSWQGATIFIKDDIANLISQLITLDAILTQKYTHPKKQLGGGADGGIALLPPAQESSLSPSDSEKEAGKVEKVEKEESDGCDVNIFLSTYMMFSYAGMYVSLFLRSPENERYMFHSIFTDLLAWDEETQRACYALYFWAALEFFQLIKFCLCFNNVFYILILYAHSTNFWLQHLSREGKEADVAVEGREVREAILNYKAVEVLNGQFNECCSSIIIPTFVSLSTMMHVIATFVTISFHNDIPIGGFLIFPIGFVMWVSIEKDIYPLLGKIDELSRNYLKVWEPRGGTQFSRHFKSLFPLGVKVSNAYSIDKSTVLSVWSTVCNLVINCIMF